MYLYVKMNPVNRYRDMSYMFGPHMPVSNSIYFGGDAQVVDISSDKIHLSKSVPPAWLVADWMIAKKRGEPLSQIAQHYLGQSAHWNDGLKWLHHYLNQ